MQRSKGSNNGISNGWYPDVDLPAVEKDTDCVSDVSSQYDVDDSIIEHYSSPVVDRMLDTSIDDIPEAEAVESQPESVYEVDESLILGYPGTPPPATQVSNSTSTGTSTRNSSRSNLFSCENVLGKRKMSPVPEAKESACKLAKIDQIPELNDCYIIAHDPRVQRLLAESGIGHGLSYELARYVSRGSISYDALTPEKLQELRAMKDVTSFKVERLFSSKEGTPELDEGDFAKMFESERSATCPWREILKEEDALAKDPEAGVGNNKDMEGWYGGGVAHRGRLVENKDGNPDVLFKIQLEQPTLGPSSRITRRFGSYTFLRIKIPDKLLYAETNLEEFFKQRFILWDKVFRAVYAKDGTVFLFWTNERYLSSGTVPGRLSFEGLFEWCNPLSSNAGQLMTKWAARTALMFSNSVPGPLIEQENIHSMKDKLSPNGESDMTDGCGETSKIIHVKLAQQLNLMKPPSAFQFRLAGFKGMSVIKVDAEDDTVPRAWFRPSQTKVSFPLDRVLDKSQRTFDILRTCRLKTSTRLSMEVIINLHENGVPASVFVDLMKESVQKLLDALTTWDGPDAMYNLWTSVERFEGVMMERRARSARGEARARGVTNKSVEDGDEEEEEEEEQDSELETSGGPRSASWWPDDVSGCPATLGETVMALLDSGFTPQESPVLREKLKSVLDKCVERETTRLRFEVLQSCNAFAIPDPCNVLGENEIHVKSSYHEFKLDDGTMTDTLVGDVLVTRNPCKVPSDTRKVKAVDHPELRRYTDVVVFSTKGNRRLIDYLAGGDYDGDTVIVFWNKLMVDNFQNAPDKFSVEPPIVETCFTRDMEMGERFVKRLATLRTESDRAHAYQNYLLGSLRSTFYVGKYSTWHDNAIYKLGYDHTETHELAAKFCRVLDSAKTGYRIKPEVYSKDRSKHDHAKGPKWKIITKGKKKQKDESNLQPLARNKDIKKPFIIDSLIQSAHALWNKTKVKIEKDFAHNDVQEDIHLSAEWKEMVDLVEGSELVPESRKARKKQLGTIALHVHTMYQQHAQMFRGQRFSSLPIRVQQDKLRKISREFVSSPKRQEVPEVGNEATLRLLRASYAYIYDREQNLKSGLGFSRFPFNVAMRELCEMKAAKLGPTKVVMGRFYERFRLSKS